MCINHPTKRALHVCRKCGKPVCELCTTTYGGRFCSAECAESFQEFTSRVQDRSVTRRTRFSIVGCLRTLVISIVLCVVIWVALWQLFGTTDPGEMWSEFRKMLRLAF